MNKDNMRFLSGSAFWCACLLLAALALSYPYISLEYLDRVDVLFHLNRIEGIKEGILSGEFPVRIHGYQMNGYGTADGIMYPDLLLYLPGLLRVCGVSIALTYNLYLIFVIFFGMAMAFWGYTIWMDDTRRGAIAAMLHGSIALYVMDCGGMPGDYPAVCSLPLAFGSLLAVLRKPGGARYWTRFVVAFTVMFQSHVITTLFTGIAAICICAFYFRSLVKHPVCRQAVMKAVIFSFLLNIWRAVPFLYFYRTISFHINHPPLVSSLHQPTVDWQSILGSFLYLGMPVFVLAIFFLWKRRFERAYPDYLMAVGFYVFLATTTSVYFPWEFLEQHFPGGHFFVNFQFPQRFLPFGIVFLCRYVGQFLADSMENFHDVWLAGIGIFCCAFGTYAALHLPWYQSGEKTVGIGNYRSIGELPSYTTKDAYLQEDYLYADVVFHEMRNREGNIPGPDDFYSDALIYNTKKQGTTISFSYEASKDSVAQMPLFYWPGYVAVDDKGKELTVRSGVHRFMEVLLPKGAGTVHVHYAGLWFFQLFDAISLVSLLAFVSLCWRQRKKVFLSRV